MITADPRYLTAFVLLTLSLLGQGISAPFGISSLAVLVMIAGLPIILPLAMTASRSAAVRRFLKSNLVLGFIFTFYFLLGFLNSKLGYPSYILSIVIHQLFYMSCLILLGPIGVWRSLRIVVWLNIAVVGVQILGSLIGNYSLVHLDFLGIDKGASIEYWGFLPRASGLMTEPAHLSYIMLPILLITLIDGRKVPAVMRRGRGLILTCYLLTFSLVAYLQLIISLLTANIQRLRFKSLFVTALASAVFGGILIAVPFARDRIDSTLMLLEGENTNSSSVFAIQSNTLVALRSIGEAPLLGNGLTSHRVTYKATIDDLFNFPLDDTWQGLNSNDAGSLILLIISENGLLGFSLFLVFMIKAILFLSRCDGELALLGLVHALTLCVVGLRYGQWASTFVMLNLQVVFFVLAVSAKKCK